MLLGVQTSRDAPQRLQAAEAKKMVAELHGEMRSMLTGQKASRVRAARNITKKQSTRTAVDKARSRRCWVSLLAKACAPAGASTAPAGGGLYGRPYR